MDTCEQVYEWLDEGEGLRLIAPFFKVQLAIQYGAMSDAWVESAAAHLRFVAEHLEPLAEESGVPGLAAFCARIGGLSGPQAFAEEFGLFEPAGADDPPWT